MTNTELAEMIFNKLGVHASGDGMTNVLRFRYHGNTYRVTTDLNVEKVDGACLVSDSDARQLEKLLRGEQWDGTGLPPVGTDCEYKDTQTGKWMTVHIKYSSDQIVVFSDHDATWMGLSVEIAKDVVIDKPEFRPLRTERDRAIEQMLTIIDCHGVDPLNSAAALYNAIVAGKIDGLGKVG